MRFRGIIMDGRMASKSPIVLLLAFVLAICLPFSATPEEAYAVINKGSIEVERNKYEQLKNEANNIKIEIPGVVLGKPEIVIGEDGSITFESTPGSSQEAPSEEAIATDEPIVEEPALDDGEEITRRPYVYVPDDDDDALSNSDPDGSEAYDGRYNGSWVLVIIMISAVIIHVVIAILIRRRDKRRKYRHPR